MTAPAPVHAEQRRSFVDELAGRVALVTGAGRGIGRVIADRLATAGATVVYGHRGGSKPDVDGVTAQLDVNDSMQVIGAVRRIADEYGRIDVLVNNAGVLPRSSFLDISLDEWELVIRTNLTGAFIVSQAVARVMATRGTGSIVHISSTNEAVASAHCTAYAASKGGIGMLTRQMALELAPLGIRTNAVAPGMVETDLNRRELSDAAFRRDALQRIPLGRFVTATDVAEAVCFLASDRAAAVNGLTLTVDGGRRAA